ncbi:MAG TPA: tRNA (N6-threonylcarbamoyladenosine(37)-N6)-methyltransferase TrmO [Polyangiaceae bacterium]|nr:tRNA (N6-threonylcarbamoyladenosine(37)-N6)-methyltransferase TrmO [Polyangiaceae bacterium]
MTSARLQLEPIGVVHSPFTEKMQAPRQPGTPESQDGSIELFAGRDFEHALEDLSTFRYIWILFWFDRAQGWRPKVLPPRSEKRRGVFATRSPHRPNPIGMSLVELSGIDGLVLQVKGLDLLEGTPVLDIKPYIPYADSRPDADHGWLDEAVIPKDPLAAFDVDFSAAAREQLALLQGFGVELEAPIRQVLSLGPEPHPYRRIRKVEGGGRLALKDFRVLFTSEGKRVTVQSVETGYRSKQLAGDDPALAPHRALAQRVRP